MRRLLVTSLVAALAALAAVSPAAAQSNPRAFQAVCEAQGGFFIGTPAYECVRHFFFSERELETQRTVCERAHRGSFINFGHFHTACIPGTQG